MFTNIFFYTFLIFLYVHTEIRYIKCSLLSRNKNPVEHVILTKTTAELNVLPKNVYNDEPFKAYRTLWRPFSRTKASSSQDLSTSTVHITRAWVSRQNRPQEESQYTKISATKFYWDNFEEDEAAWPKVVLVLTSTVRTTTPRKIKKTFASYFPFLSRSTANAASDDQNDTGKDDAVAGPSMIWNAINFAISGDKFIHPEEEDERQEADENIDIMTSTAAITAGRRKDGKTNSTHTRITKCYECGLTDQDIPFKPTCYHIFDSTSDLYWNLRPHYKVSCKNREGTNDSLPSFLYKGGCFKRFLDIGETYNERGCRTMPPLQGKSFASNRFMMLEKTLHLHREGCVSSPQASLTPFSRAISLFARYHVCICVGKYCNRGNTLHTNSSILVFLSVLACTYIAYKPFGMS